MGVFTDTALYRDIIPECTNISVGYFHAHSSQECIDAMHVYRLICAACALLWRDLGVYRDPVAEQAQTKIIGRGQDSALYADPRGDDRDYLPLWGSSTSIPRRSYGFDTDDSVTGTVNPSRSAFLNPDVDAINAALHNYPTERESQALALVRHACKENLPVAELFKR